MIELTIIYECAVCKAKNKFESDDDCICFDTSKGRKDYTYLYDECVKCGAENAISIDAVHEKKD